VPRFDGTAGDTLQDSGIIIDDSDNVSGVNDLDAATITLPGGGVQTQLDEKIDGPTIASSTDNAIVRWDGTGGRAAQNSTVTVSDVGVIAGATIDGDDNTVRDLALSTIKTVLADANEILRRDVAGVVVSGPATVDADGNLSGLKTITVRNDDDLSGASAHILRLDNHNNAPGSHPFVDFQRARAGNTNLQNGDEVGGLDFRPRFNGNTQTTAKIQVEYTGNGTTRLSDIVFQTSNGSTPAERMRIAADGKVTIAGDFEVQGTTTTINTTNLEVEDKNITVNFGGTDASATGAGLTVEGTGGLDLAAIQYDATLGSKWKVGASGSEDEVVTRTLAQTLTNKTINGSNNTITNVSLSTGVTGTLPITNGGTGQISKTAAFDALSPQTTKGDLIAFDGADAIRLGTGVNGQVLSANSSATSGLEWVDAPTAGGFINYITNPSAESSTTGWATYADAAAATPADGTGGSPNVTWTRNTSSPIRGNADFAFAKDAANRQGQGVAFAFTLATTDRSKKCQITFDYDTSTANYSAGDLRVYIYDVTNATLVTPQAVSIPKGVNTFQTTFDSTTSTSYRLILHVATTNAAAYTVDFDNFVVNAGEVVQGAAVGTWEETTSYTVTASTTNPTYGAGATQYRRTDREGRFAIVRWEFQQANAGTAGTGTYRLPLPTGLTIDFAYLLRVANVSAAGVVGQGRIDNGTNYLAQVIADTSLSNSLNVVLFNDTTAYTNWSGLAVTFASNPLRFSFEARIPIAEWAGNGTVNLGAGAQVEYAADDGSSDVFGPNGALVPNLAASTGQTNRNFSFNYPQQATQDLVVQINYAGLGWSSAADLWPFSSGNNGSASNSYGVRGFWTSATNFRVVFGNRGTEVSASNVDNGVTSWATEFAAGTRFRVAKANPSSPVGYGQVNSNEFGLMPPQTAQTSLTVTCAQSGYSTVRAVGIAYRDQAGVWRLRFNITATFSSATVTSVTMTVSGVTFKNIGFPQAGSGSWGNNSSVIPRVLCNNNASTITLDSASATSVTGMYCSGDVELESRPSWA
jgi:hypothetical protein